MRAASRVLVFDSFEYWLTLLPIATSSWLPALLVVADGRVAARRFL